MQTLSNFFHYLLDSVPGTEFRYYVPLLVLSVLLVIGAIVFSQIYKRRKKFDYAFKRLFKSVSGRLIIIGILILILVAVRYEQIPYFSMRLWLYAVLLFLLYTTYKYIKVYLKDYPKEKANVEKKTHFSKKEENKYLPNKKKK